MDKSKLFYCYDCGSTIKGHHTQSCECTEDTDIRDLPQVEGTQYWTESQGGKLWLNKLATEK